MSGYAWVTLATNNAYSLGALVLAHSLKKQKTAHKLAVLITPAVSPSMREQLQTVFDLVKVVDVLDSKDEAHLALMKRPDLGITFTKIHCWRLVEFEKCVFLDADTLVVRNCDELFEREEFSAAPDVSWPDCFNSGVFVYRPSVETFNKILQFAVENRSFDGGDQGLLNQYFSDWATEDIKKHLPFVYNLTSVAAYSYIPAFKHYGAETRIVHFIGTGKPWLQQLDVATKTVTPTSGSEHLAPLLQQWWDLFCEKVHPNLDKNLESSNDGMSHTPVEACSNSLPNALIDESQTPHLIEPCTPYREKDDFRQCNLPYQPFDVKGSSGELLNVEFLLASVVPPKALEVSLDEQQRLEEDKMEEKGEAECREEEKKAEYEKPEGGGLHTFQDNNGPTQQLEISERKIEEEENKNLQQQEEEQKQEEPPPPPPKDPFDYNSFVPDETCINNYLERNIETYHPFENHPRQEDTEKNTTNSESDHEQSVPLLPRFLTIPEDDRRQSGNVETHPLEGHYHSNTEPTQDSRPIMQQVHIPEHVIQQREPPREDVQPEPLVEKRELTKSKSMPYLPFDVTIEPPLPPARSIWKSQPDVNAELNRKYSMPKLKPLLPKQNSFSKSLPSAMPKVTLYTEFLMSSEYKDPDDLPKDKVGFVETQIHKEAKLRRSKSEVDMRSKFGPLPYATSPEVERPIIPKKVPFQPLGNELYDLTQCKRQMGNKPKSKDGQKRKENIRSLPALKPIVPVPDKKSTLIKKRKSKELSPGNVGRGKIPRTEPKSVKQRKKEAKVTPRNVSAGANSNGLDEILNRLREFSKDYQHFFGPVPETKKKTVKCKNTTVQASDQNEAECSMSETFEVLSTPTRTRSKETQTPKEDSRGSLFEGLEFLTFRNYLKNQREASEKGLINIQGILSEPHRSETEVIKSSIPDGKDEVGDESHCAAGVINFLKIGEESIRLTDENIPMKGQEVSVHSVKVHSEYHNLTEPIGKGCDLESSVGADSNQRQTKSSRSAESVGQTANNLDQSDKVETNGGIEETVQSRQVSLFTAPSSKMGKSKDTAELEEKTYLNSKEQKEELTNGNEEETNKGELPTKGSQMIRKDEGDVIHAEECSESTEVTKTPVPNCGVDLKLHRKDASDAVSLRPSREVQRTSVSEKNCNESIQGISPSLGQKDRETTSEGATAEPEPVSCRQEMGDDESRRTLRAESPTKTLASVISSPTTSQTDQNSRVSFNEEAEINEGFREGNTQSDVGDTINADAAVARNPEDTLCVPDFDTPRSSRVTHSPNAASASVEEKTKTESPIYQRKKLQKAGKKSKNKTPANGLANGQITENRFDLPSNNSPDGTVRFENKKTPEKKSGMQTPFSRSLSTPEKGNAEPENPEDQMSTSGIAGAIAQLSLEAGSGQSPESAATSTAHQEYIRRQNWETGNMDYMGKDSFDNIWSKICQTIEAKETEVGGTSENSKTMKTDAEKPKETPPAERAASLSSTLQKCPEYIETLPGEPAAGPVEDDEIIFSKAENKQSCLTNIVEEEEVGTEGSGGTVPALVKGGVKLSDILNPTMGAGEGGKTPVGMPHQTGKPQHDVGAGVKKVQESMEKGQPAEVLPGGKSQSSLENIVAAKPIVVPAEVKTPSPVAAPAETKPQAPLSAQGTSQAPPSPAEVKPQVPTSPAEAKPQAPPSPAEGKPQPAPPVQAKPQPAASPTDVKPQPAATPAEAKPQAPPSPAEVKPQVPTSPAECKPQPAAIPTEAKPLPAATPAEGKPQTVPSAQAKPQPATSPAEAKPQAPPSPAEGKPQPAPPVQAKPQPAASPADVKPQSAAIPKEAKPQTATSPAETKPLPAATPVEGKPQPAPSAQAKPQPVASPAEVKSQAPPSAADVKPQPAATPAEVKLQAPPSPAEGKPQPAATPTEAKPQTATSPAEAKPLPAATPAEGKSQAPPSAADVKPQPAATPAEVKPQTATSPAEAKPLPAATPAEGKPQPAPSAQAKPQAAAIPAEVKSQAAPARTETKAQSAATPTEAKSQPAAPPAGVKPQAAPSAQAEHQPAAAPSEEIKSQSDCKTVEISQPPAPSPQCPSSDAPKQPETPVKDESQECKTVAIMSPSSVFPGIQTTGKGKKRSKGKKAEVKSPESLEPIPLPAPDSGALESGSEPSNHEGKQKKGVFTKILEIVGVTPKEKNGNEISKSVFYDVEKGVPAVEVGEEMIKQVVEESEKPSEGAVPGPGVETKQSTGGVPEKKTPPPTGDKTGKELPPAKPEEKKTDPAPVPSSAVEDPEVKQSDKTEEQKPQAKGNENSGTSEGKHKNRGKKQKSGQQSMPKPARNSSPKEQKQPKDVADASATKQKPPSPKLTMPQKLPETEVTTPTPPPQPDVPPRRNSALLVVDDSILETPPVPEPPKESADEAAKGKVSSEIEDIIGKAKSEVESLLQGPRSAEKESGESTDLINTMKLIMGEEQPPKEAAEEVEELRVTSEEERKKQKGSKSSKLSDQILKAIPPPRRKAISEASASTSGIPAAPAAPEQKTSAEENKGKAAKPSSIPVPPPRSRGKPSQPAPPKGKAKK